MTKSKKHGIERRRTGALERLRYLLEITEKALSTSKELEGNKKKGFVKKKKRINKEIDNLEKKLKIKL